MAVSRNVTACAPVPPVLPQHTRNGDFRNEQDCILTAAIVATVIATPALALPSRGVPVASAQLDGIRNWDAPNADTLYVNAQDGKWYEARMASPCWQLPTATRLKIDMASPGTLDSASTVSVGHEHCTISSLSRVDGPRDPLLSKPI